MAATNKIMCRLFAVQILLFTQMILSPNAIGAEGDGLVSPAQGSTLSGTSQSFAWQIENIEESWLYAGSTAGDNSYHNSGSLGQATAATIHALPNDGRTIHLRLFYRSSGQSWRHFDYTFQAVEGTSAIDLVTPAPGSTITSTQQSFSWRGDGMDEWWMYAGSSSGSSDIYNSGNLGSATSIALSALPHDGRTVYVRLFYRQASASWRYRDYTFTSHTGERAINMVSPASGSTLTNPSQTFTWQGAGIADWWLYVGSSEGNWNIHNSGNLGSATSTTISSLPVDGGALHVRLFYRQSPGSWRYVDFSYQTATRNDQATDLVALHYDVAPDLDDLHAIAAGSNLSDKYGISPAVVIGAYGLVGLGGPVDSDLKYLYDTATNSLGQGPNIGETRQQKAQQVTDAAYGAGTYIDTGNGWTAAVNAQAEKFWNSLQNGYTVSVADGGPMDFTADVLRRLQSFHGASPQQLKRVMVVQHSLGFNLSNTLPSNRTAVSELATYVTIDNGNVGGNATANLRAVDASTTSGSFATWARTGNNKSAAWISALTDFNSKVDFSDTVEYLYILDIPLSSVSDINSFSRFF